MKLIDEKRHWWKWLSVHALALTGILPAVWVSLPADWRASIPGDWLAVVTVVTAVMGVFGRIVQQGDKPDNTDGAGA